MLKLYAIYDNVSNDTITITAHRTDEEAVREFKLSVQRIDAVYAESLKLVEIGVYDPSSCVLISNNNKEICKGKDFVNEVSV